MYLKFMILYNYKLLTNYYPLQPHFLILFCLGSVLPQEFISSRFGDDAINFRGDVLLSGIHFGDVEILCRGDVSLQMALAAVYYHGWIVGVHCGVYDTIAFPKDTVHISSKFYK